MKATLFLDSKLKNKIQTLLKSSKLLEKVEDESILDKFWVKFSEEMEADLIVESKITGVYLRIVLIENGSEVAFLEFITEFSNPLEIIYKEKQYQIVITEVDL